MKNPDNPIQRLKFVQDKMLSNPAQNKAQMMMMFLLPSSFLCFVDDMSYVSQNESIWCDISRKHHKHPQWVQPFQQVFRGLLVFTLLCNAICCDRQAKWIPGAFYVPERHWNSTMWNSAKLASIVNFHDRSSFFFEPTLRVDNLGIHQGQQRWEQDSLPVKVGFKSIQHLYINHVVSVEQVQKHMKTQCGWILFWTKSMCGSFVCVLGWTSHDGCFTPHAACLG